MCKQQPCSLANSKPWLQWPNQIVYTESLHIKFWNLSCLFNFITGFFLYGFILFPWLIMPTFVSYFATMPHPPLSWEFMDCSLGLGIKMSLNHSIRITPSSHNTSYNLFSCLSANAKLLDLWKWLYGLHSFVQTVSTTIQVFFYFLLEQDLNRILFEWQTSFEDFTSWLGKIPTHHSKEV